MSSRNRHYRGASVINSWCHRGATQSIHGTYYRAVFNVCILSHHYWVFIMTTQMCSFLAGSLCWRCDFQSATEKFRNNMYVNCKYIQQSLSLSVEEILP